MEGKNDRLILIHIAQKLETKKKTKDSYTTRAEILLRPILNGLRAECLPDRSLGSSLVNSSQQSAWNNAHSPYHVRHSAHLIV